MYKYKKYFLYQHALAQLISSYFRVDPFTLISKWNIVLSRSRIAVVPVPMSRRKESDRGFSPAFEIAALISRLLAFRGVMDLRIFPRLLCKTDNQQAQASKSRIKRLLSLQQAYSLNSETIDIFLQYQPEVIIIVDDILTTGATTNVIIEQLAKHEQVRNMLRNCEILRFTFASS